METKIIQETEQLVKTLTETYQDIKNLFFVQIGSNDGKTQDPIHNIIRQYHWKGVLVEPVPYLFQQLLQTYEGYNDLHFENSAIAGRSGFRNFYQLRQNNDPDVPHWYSLLGSFKKDVVTKHREWIPNFDKYFMVEKVPCISFSGMLNKYHVRNIDFLHIDAEGYDFEIIKLVPFKKIKPRMIFFEFIHLSESDLKACRELLAQHRYSLSTFKTDILAIHHDGVNN